MIPQRNISLLANRLAKEGGRRISESVLERDYCLAWFLSVLAESDLKPIFGFKGGTALKRCYFGGYRFSEDLDFTLTEAIAFDELARRLDPIYAALREASGIVFNFDREDRQKHDNSYTFYLRYVGPLPTGSNVKVDVTLRERLVFFRSGIFPFSAAMKNSQTFPRTGFCGSTRWRKSQPRKRSPSRIERAMNRETSMICGISHRARGSNSVRSRMRCARSLSFVGNRSRASQMRYAIRRLDLKRYGQAVWCIK